MKKSLFAKTTKLLGLGLFVLLAAVSCKKTILPSQQKSSRLKTNTTYTTLTQLIVDNTNLIKTVVSDNEISIAAGVTETDVNYTNQGDSAMHLFLLKVNLTTANLHMEVGTPGDLYSGFGQQTVLGQAQNVDGANHRVLAAINGDFVDQTDTIHGGVVDKIHRKNLGPLHKNGTSLNETFGDSTRSSNQQGISFFGLSSSNVPQIGRWWQYASLGAGLYNVTGGAGKVLVENGAIVPQSIKTIDPRTAIGYDNSNNVYIVVIDGRRPTYSNGMNYDQLAQIFHAFGAAYAINLDGGGSSTFITKNPSSGSLEVRNWPTDAAGPRAVVDSWLIYLSKVTVSTYAGNGTAGLVNGSASSAEFDSPEGVAVDGSGNIFVADKDNNCIRKITTGGTVSVFAGSTSGTAGYVDATGTSARFNLPWKLAIDGSNNIYVADRDNFKIRKITSAGVVTTLAGSTQGFADGTGSAAKFGQPLDVAVDLSGNIIVADNTNHCIRKVTTAGVVTTIAGVHGVAGYHNDANPLLAKFDNPSGVTVASTGDIYVADRTNHVIRKITSASGVVFVAGMPFTQGAHDGTGSGASFSNPYGVGMSGSNVLVADLDSSLIRSVTSSGVVTTVAGNRPGFKNADGTNAWFNQPTAVVTDASGNIYVADHANQRIRKVVIAP